MSDPDPEYQATIQYRLNLSCALYPISPALSALHTSRAASLHPGTSAILCHSHCPKCGVYRFSSSQTGPPAKRRAHRKAPQKRCRLCGFSIDARTSSSLPAQSKTAAVPRNNEPGYTSSPAESPNPIAETIVSTTHTPIPPFPGQQSHPKSSKVSLKDMLSHNRQMEEGAKAHKKRKEGHDGLAAFLKEL